MKFAELENKNILLLGMGVEGQSALKVIRARFPQARISVADRNESASVEAQDSVPLQRVILGPDYLKHLGEFDAVIKSPGVPWGDEVRGAHQAGKLTSATEIFFDTVGRDKIIGVTGSKGKTTVATLIHRVLQEAGKNAHLLGNVGACALDFLDKDVQDALFVYELSSYQLEGMRVSPKIAVWTTFFPSHLSYHGSMAAYAAAKSNIARFQREGDTFIYNARYREIQEVARTSGGSVVSYNHPESYHLENATAFMGEEKLFSLAGAKPLGAHNKENMLGVIAASLSLGVDFGTIEKALSSFEGLPHRLEHAGTAKGIDFYNDSIAVAPEAALAAIEVFGERLGTVILGGVDNDHDFSELIKKLFEHKVQNIVVMGANAKKIQKELQKQSMFYEKKDMYEPEVSLIGESDGAAAMEGAVASCLEHTQEGKVCLLSPGAQSFDLYKNFEERGERFMESIKKLATPNDSA